MKFGGNFRRYDISDYTFSVLNNPEVLITGLTHIRATATAA